MTYRKKERKKDYWFDEQWNFYADADYVYCGLFQVAIV